MIKRDETYMLRMVDYLLRNVQKGYNLETLKWALINQGHSRLEVEKALVGAQQKLSQQSTKKVIPEVMPQQTIQIEPEQPKSFWKRLFG